MKNKRLKKLRDKILWEKFYFNRGKSIVSDIMEIILGMASIRITVQGINGLFHTDLNPDKAMLIIPPLMITYWVLGRFDFKIIHIIQKENEIANEANPSLYNRIKRIDKNINKMHKKNGGTI
jgi:hypothetical protein